MKALEDAHAMKVDACSTSDTEKFADGIAKSVQIAKTLTDLLESVPEVLDRFWNLRVCFYVSISFAF